MYSFVRTGNCAIRIEKSPRLRIIIRQAADNPGRFGARAERVSAPAPNTSDFPLTCPVFYLSNRTGKILTLSHFLLPCFPPIFSFVHAFFQSIAHICALAFFAKITIALPTTTYCQIKHFNTTFLCDISKQYRTAQSNIAIK